MSKKKKEKTKEESTVVKPATIKSLHPGVTDPCFHCKYMQLTSTGMDCEKGAPAFWGEHQGWEPDPNDPTLPGDFCKFFCRLPAKKKGFFK